MGEVSGAPIHAWLMYLSARKTNVRVFGAYAHPLRSSTAGFTLVELLVVLVIIGILLAIAVPAYSMLTDRARTRTAEQQIRAAMPAAQAFYLDNDTYVGLGNSKKKSPPGITFYDAAVSAQVGTGSKGKPTATSYCLNATVGDATLSASGPAPIAWYQKKNCAGTSSASAP